MRLPQAACRQRRKRARGGEHLKVGCRGLGERRNRRTVIKSAVLSGEAVSEGEAVRRSSASGQTDVGRGWVTKSPLDLGTGVLVILLKALSLGVGAAPRGEGPGKQGLGW